MKNKFTEAIDKAFEVLGTKESEFLILGHCYRDNDGEWGEVGDMLTGEEDAGEFSDRGWECCPVDTPEYGTDGYKKADKVFEDLVGMINKSYPKLLEPDYSGTNQCWTRYYFITRDYELKSACSMVHDLGEEMNRDQLIFDFSKIQADVADAAEEKEAIKQIKSHIKDIEGLLVSVKTEAGKKTIRDRIMKSKIKEFIKEK